MSFGPFLLLFLLLLLLLLLLVSESESESESESDSRSSFVFECGEGSLGGLIRGRRAYAAMAVWTVDSSHSTQRLMVVERRRVGGERRFGGRVKRGRWELQ